jgi:hypothetical protein
MTSDPDHAAMLVEAQERADREGAKQSSAPPMSTWSAEVEALAVATDKLSNILYVLRATNGDKQSKPPKPIQRPETALPRIKAQKRQEKHEALAARLLGR